MNKLQTDEEYQESLNVMALGKNVDEIIPLLENEKQSTLDYY